LATIQCAHKTLKNPLYTEGVSIKKINSKHSRLLPVFNLFFITFLNSFKMKKFYILLSMLIIICQVQAQKIYEIYPAGGAGGSWTNDYVILSGFSANQNVVGKSLQYRGSGSSGIWTVMSLTGTADATGFYRIWLNNSSVGAPWTPQLSSGTFTMSNTGSVTNCLQLALMNITTQITALTCPSGGTVHDLVGWIGTNGGTSGCFETAPTGMISSTTSRRRFQETNDNSADFSVINNPYSVLPVELISFDATTEGDKNHLTWRTASELNNKLFDIERSTDGTTFHSIGQVKGNNKPSSYQFVDNQPFATSYYRLRQIDFDGTETLSKVVSVELKGKGKSLAVYPNPVSSLLNVVYTEGSSFQILNLLGQQVLTGKTASQVDVSALPQGSYILKVGAEQAKFLKQ
jgi:Secretion system C-terminal sorting domain